MTGKLQPAIERMPTPTRRWPSQYDELGRYRVRRPLPLVPAVLTVVGLCLAAKVVL